MHFPRRAEPAAAIMQPQHRADSFGIARGAHQADAEAWLGLVVVVELGCIGILTDNQVDSAIAIVVKGRRPPALTINQQPALFPRDRLEAPVSQTLQQCATAAVIARGLRWDGEK